MRNLTISSENRHLLLHVIRIAHAQTNCTYVVPGMLAALHLLQDFYELLKKTGGGGAEASIHAVFWKAVDEILKVVCKIDANMSYFFLYRTSQLHLAPTKNQSNLSVNHHCH